MYIIIIVLLYQFVSKSFKDFIQGYNSNNISKSDINFDKNNENNSYYEISDLKKQLRDEKYNKRILQDEIDELKDANRELKQENKNIIKKYKKEIQILNDTIKELNKDKEMKKLNDIIKDLENKISIKDKEITDYIFKLNNLENNNQLIAFNQRDTDMSVFFMTQGNQDIRKYSMSCKSTDLFVRLEEKLYQVFPKYRNIEAIFMVNARRIMRFKTLEENKIKHDDIINLFSIEEI